MSLLKIRHIHTSKSIARLSLDILSKRSTLRPLHLKQAPQLAKIANPNIPSTRQSLVTEGPEPQYENVVEGFEEFRYSSQFNLVQGGSLQGFSLAYETWGNLSPKKDNAILVFTGLSASSHAKSGAKNQKPGWWEKFIGPGLAIDTDKFFVVGISKIIERYAVTFSAAATALRDLNQSTLQLTPFALSFPLMSIPDIVASQFKLLDHLGIDCLYGSVGASMGGMSSLASAAMFPNRVGRLISISAAARSHPYSIALRHTQRKVLISDPKWNEGDYYSTGPPEDGMRLSRQIATISYRSGPEWESRFGRKRVDGAVSSPVTSEYLIESYLDHQGVRFSKEYDANSFLYLSKAMDTFDISARTSWAAVHASSTRVQKAERSIGCDLDQVVAGLSSIDMPTLVLGVQSDILFPVWQQKEYADAIRAINKNVTYYELDTLFGHDTFLLDTVSVGGAMKGFLENKNIQ